GGEVRVALTQVDEAVYLLAVEDDGRGMPAEVVPRGPGLGTRIIRSMAQSLHAAVEYEPRDCGVRAVLRGAMG
ncbi:ATP-binding protein, partial [Streptomyces scabiei]|uniref:ATP-binding protein n=1 Tax=Streptomyces scabiei TaxID=1930 RepID=UPI0038F6885C